MTGGSEFIEAGGSSGGSSGGSPEGMPLVSVRDVTRTFPGGASKIGASKIGASGSGASGSGAKGGARSPAVRALDGVSLDIAAGSVFTLLGPSGCGKTTLLRLVAGFEHPDRGDVLLDGRSILAEPPNRRPVNTVFQSYALFPHMSVAENVGFGLRCRGLRGRALAARVGEALALVRLDALAGRRPAALSGGQQQRVALARALAPRPRMVLLDEPLSALDPELRRGMQAELKRIQRDSGIAFLLVTHDREEAFSLSDRIAVMEAGRVLQIGGPRDIAERPASRAVAAFTGANVLDLPRGSFAVRPERVAVRRPRAPAAPGPAPAPAPASVPACDGTLILAGRVAALAFLGARTACTVALDAGGTLQAERDDLPEGLDLGDPVACVVAGDVLVPLAG